MLPTMLEQVEQLIKAHLDPDEAYRIRLRKQKKEFSEHALRENAKRRWDASKRRHVLEAIPMDGSWIRFSDLKPIFAAKWPEMSHERMLKQLAILTREEEIEKSENKINPFYRRRFD
jgi:hypothetical protein